MQKSKSVRFVRFFYVIFIIGERKRSRFKKIWIFFDAKTKMKSWRNDTEQDGSAPCDRFFQLIFYLLRVGEPKAFLVKKCFFRALPNWRGMAVRKDSEMFEEMLVSSKTLEALFGVKDRTIRDLTEKGIIKRDSHGKYLFWDSAKSYIVALKIANAGKNQAKDEEQGLNYEEEHALHEHIKRQITEIKLQLIKGQVHKAEDVEAVMTDMFSKFKSKMTALPSKLAKKLEGKNKIEIQEILKREIDNALVELASYNPADFYSDERIIISDEDISSLGVDEDGE